MSRSAAGWVIFAAVAAALALRLADPAVRPMHHDEANQAAKFGVLLERGEYVYDKDDHHGPVLYYATLPFAWAFGRGTLQELDEAILRAVPAFFGAGTILLLALFFPGPGRRAGSLAALILALSPAMTYYARFYIQETLFVFFTVGFLASVGRYLLRPTGGWAILAGVFAGLAAATKETAAIVFASVVLSLAAVLLLQRFAVFRGGSPVRIRILPGDFLLFLLVAAAVAAAFFSSFGNNPQGLTDALTALEGYISKGISAGPHTQGAGYYLGLLLFTKSGGLVWSEGFVLLLGAVGMIAVFIPRGKKEPLSPEPLSADRSMGRFLALTTLAATLAFSFLPYKTPWNCLPFLAGWILMAGIGGAEILRWAKPLFLKAVVLLFLAAGLGWLGFQAYRASFVFPADPRNPYAYAQTSPDVLKLAQRVRELADVHQEGRDLLVMVIAPPDEQWPLPWYLRDYRRVGYWTDAGATGRIAEADILIASAEASERIERRMENRAQASLFELRPNVFLTLWVERSLWESFIKNRRPPAAG